LDTSIPTQALVPFDWDMSLKRQQCIITMAAAKAKIYYGQHTIMEDANLFIKVLLTMGKSLVN
jgi:hypothetical protein